MSLRTPRILVTGSRAWDDYACIRDTLRFEFIINHRNRDAVLVHGGCPTGADAMADKAWRKQQLPIEIYPADWSLGKQAGYIRNKEMVDSNPTVCYAFILNESKGATMTAQLAQDAGIPTYIIRRNT